MQKRLSMLNNLAEGRINYVGGIVIAANGIWYYNDNEEYVYQPGSTDGWKMMQDMFDVLMDRPAIQPRVTIVDTPEGNTTDDILVTLYNLKEIEITLIEEFLRLLVKSLHVWIVLLLKFKLLADFRSAESFRIRKHVHIQLRQHHLHAFTSKSLDALLILSIVRV